MFLRFLADKLGELQSANPILAVVIQLIVLVLAMIIMIGIGNFLIRRSFRILKTKVRKSDDKRKEEKLTQIANMRKMLMKIWRYAVYLLAIPFSIILFNLSLTSYADFQRSLFGIPLLGRFIQSTIVIILAFIGLKFGQMGIRAAFSRKEQEHYDDKVSVFQTIEVKESKLRTLETLSLSLFQYLVYFIVILTLLTIFGVSTTSIITSAGILGVALGFGAQDLVKDIIAGAFIIFEDHFNVGEYIVVEGVEGTVVQIGLRSTQLEARDGKLHIIPNGEIALVSNLSRNYMRATVDLGVAYGENLPHVYNVLEEACKELAGKYDWIIEGPKIRGVQELADSAVVIRITARAKSIEYRQVERIMRFHLKNKLDEAGVEIPFPHRVIINKG